jgi:hypothetical protein
MQTEQQNEKKKASEPKPPVAVPPAEKGELEISGIRLPANVMLSNAESSVMRGASYHCNLGISGIVQAIRLTPGGHSKVFIRQSDKRLMLVIIQSSGMELTAGEVL